jgi:hypothetical protein
MALRGFKDLDADSLQTYAGTAGRLSQRILTREAACHPEWEVLTVDVNKAFLQGAAYKELQELTGDEPREVCFTLPKGMAEIIRTLPGYEDYDERIHCLQCDKPGTGSKDAPRAFSVKLASVTRSPQIGLRPTTYDPELEVKHKLRNGKMQPALLIAKHVDDLKITGEPHEVQLFMEGLEKVFGKLTTTKNEFTNCGVRHRRLKDGSLTMDQDDYIKALIPIAHKDLVGKAQNEPATPELESLFRSLLGAIAYTQLTQHQIACYVVALQRAASKLTIGEIRRLSVLCKRLQKKPLSITCSSMCTKDQTNYLTVFSDAGFN